MKEYLEITGTPEEAYTLQEENEIIDYWYKHAKIKKYRTYIKIEELT